MADKKSILPRFEILIILVFFISFLGWAANKCSRTKTKLQAESTALTADSLNQLVDTVASSANTIQTPTVTSTPDPIIEAQAARPILYVVIDDLNMRSAPNLNSDVVSVLNLFDEVEFMNEVTDSTTQLKLSETITVNEPWVKVKNKRGRTGWVYGAGVHYHRKKYPGL
jgi:Na+-transporting methylmalonyl-CoA/oxaloacetate decarboxylase gamma subunit